MAGPFILFGLIQQGLHRFDRDSAVINVQATDIVQISQPFFDCSPKLTIGTVAKLTFIQVFGVADGSAAD